MIKKCLKGLRFDFRKDKNEDENLYTDLNKDIIQVKYIEEPPVKKHYCVICQEYEDINPRRRYIPKQIISFHKECIAYYQYMGLGQVENMPENICKLYPHRCYWDSFNKIAVAKWGMSDEPLILEPIL